MTVALGIVSLVLIGFSLPRFGCIRLDRRHFPFPSRAVMLLRRGGARGHLAVDFDWGEYVLWHLGPRVQVSLDGRRETVYTDAAYRQQLDFRAGTGDWNAFLRTTPTDMILLRRGTAADNLMRREPGWVAVYADTLCMLYWREGWNPELLDRLARLPLPPLPDDGDGLCFPGVTPRQTPRDEGRTERTL